MSKYKEYLSKSKARSASILLILMLFAWYCFFGWKYGFVYNVGDSMYPTYKNKELLVVQKTSTLTESWQPRRYDNVIVKTKWYEKLTKRIIGLEGEYIFIKTGKIYVDGELHEDPYGKGDVIYYIETEEERKSKPKNEWLFFNVNQDIGLIPKGHVFIIGDNRNLSWFGIVSIEDITDLVIF